jgi:GTPase SAR1 family protein
MFALTFVLDCESCHLCHGFSSTKLWSNNGNKSYEEFRNMYITVVQSSVVCCRDSTVSTWRYEQQWIKIAFALQIPVI